MDKSNTFTSLKDPKMLNNRRFYLDRIDSYLAHVESHVTYDSDGGDLLDPLGSSASVPKNISSSENDQ